MVKKSMSSTEGETALSSMTLTVYLDKSKNVFSFPLAKLGPASPHSHFNISTPSSLAEYAPVHEELQLSNLRKFFFTSHICRQVVVNGLETLCSLFLSISIWIKPNLFFFLCAGLHLTFSHPHKTEEGAKSLNRSLIEYHHNWIR